MWSQQNNSSDLVFHHVRLCIDLLEFYSWFIGEGLIYAMNPPVQILSLAYTSSPFRFSWAVPLTKNTLVGLLSDDMYLKVSSQQQFVSILPLHRAWGLPR
jgi:hypothetical protein